MYSINESILKTSPSSVNASSMGKSWLEIFLISRSNDSMKPQYKNSNNRTHTCLFEPMGWTELRVHRPLDSWSPLVFLYMLTHQIFLGARVRIRISRCSYGIAKIISGPIPFAFILASFRRRSSNHKILILLIGATGVELNISVYVFKHFRRKATILARHDVDIYIFDTKISQASTACFWTCRRYLCSL